MLIFVGDNCTGCGRSTAVGILKFKLLSSDASLAASPLWLLWDRCVKVVRPLVVSVSALVRSELFGRKALGCETSIVADSVFRLV